MATQGSLLAGRCAFETLVERLVDVAVRGPQFAVFVDEPTPSIEVVERCLIRVQHGGVGVEKHHPGGDLIQARGEIVVLPLERFELEMEHQGTMEVRQHSAEQSSVIGIE